MYTHVNNRKLAPMVIQRMMENNYSIACDRPWSVIRRPVQYVSGEVSRLIAYAFVVTEETPDGIELSSNSEAISYPNSSNWLLTMQEEMESLHKNGSWDLCELPQGRRALTVKWSTS